MNIAGMEIGVIPSVVAALVFILFLAFIAWYILPSRGIGKRLRNSIREIKKLKNAGGVVSKEHVSRIMQGQTLQHLWTEYAETLHDQHEEHEGERRLVQIRATLPSEVFFSTQTLVDTPMRTEFFKHLPGILTGIGIIGTFLGLIVGLEHFHPADEAEQVKASLAGLMAGVKDAFYASAFAIFTAMLITTVEKLLLTARYKEVEDLSQAIDSLYDAGAGEEYLSRLVQSAEESATQTRLLKDSLVEDMKALMTNLVERQIEAGHNHNQHLASQISLSINDSLKEPLNQIARVVEKASGNQGAAIQGMLENLLVAFMEKIETTFGGQMAGLNAMMAESVRSMREMQEGFQKLLGDLGAAGQANSAAMAEKLAQAMTDAESRQRELNQQMAQFVASIHQTAGQSQIEASGLLNKSLEQMKNQMMVMMGDFSKQRHAVADEERQRQTELHTQTNQLVSGLGDEIGQLVKHTAESVVAMRDNIGALNQVAVESIQKMNSGAETMYLAAGEFTAAGQQVGAMMKQADETFSKLAGAGISLGRSADVVQGIVAEYAKSRDTFAEMVETLRQLLGNTKVEAGVGKQIVADMQAVAEKLSEVQRQTDQYLDQVSDVLETSFNSFGDAVEKSLNRSKGEFDKSLSEAVGMLRAVIEELADAASMAAKV